jgi:hypothetical protein
MHNEHNYFPDENNLFNYFNKLMPLMLLSTWRTLVVQLTIRQRRKTTEI